MTNNRVVGYSNVTRLIPKSKNTYWKTLRSDWKHNEFATSFFVLGSLIAFLFTLLAVAVSIISGKWTGFGNSMTFPILFWSIGLLHWFVRPAVLLHYKKKEN